LRPLRSGDEADAAFALFEALVAGFEHVVVDFGEEVVADDFDGDAVPGVGIEFDLDLLQLLTPRLFRDAAHLLNPDGRGCDHHAALVEVRFVRVAAYEADLWRRAELELAGEHIVAEVHDVLAHSLVAVRAFLARAFLHGVGRAVFDAPGADAAAPAVGAGLLFFGEGFRLIKSLGGNEFVRLAGLRGGRSWISGESERRDKKEECEVSFHGMRWCRRAFQ